jgi:hypothetical protein
MNTTAINAIPEATSAHWEPKYPFDLVVAYEDTTTRNRAMQLYDHLAQQLLDDYDFQVSWWKLDHLDNPRLCEQAADAAAVANMVVVSLRGDQQMPVILNRWLQGWLSRKDHQKSALVVLLGAKGQPTDEARRMQSHLQQAARQAKMDFFAHAYELDELEKAYTPESVARRAHTVTPVLEEILQQPTSYPRWGINE